MRKLFFNILAVAALASTFALAQNQPATSTEGGQTVVANVPRNVDTHHDNNWGWLGLFGLFGLAGLRRRDDRGTVVRRDFNDRNDVEIRRVG